MENLTIRLERETDHRCVEELTREAFWNLYLPGCDEHYLVHLLRKSPDFIPELAFVAEVDDQVVGNIMYTHSYILTEQKQKFPTITFGPISVLPEYQDQGIGSHLIEHSLVAAKELGYQAIMIFGYAEYYQRFGFQPAKEFGISDMVGKYPAAHLILELTPSVLDNVSGKAFQSNIYQVCPADAEKYDQNFPYKEKKTTKSQQRYAESLAEYL